MKIIFLCVAVLVVSVLLSIMPLSPAVLHAFAATPEISVRPRSVNFGSVRVGITSDPRIVTVRNTGSVNLTVNSISISDGNAAEFSQTNNCTTIPAQGSCSITVTFTPSIPFGKKSTIMSIASDDPRRPTVHVKLSGQAPPPKISLSPGSVKFGSVQTDTSASRVVTIKNRGISDLVINSITVAGTDAAEFGQTNDCTTIAQGGACAVTVTCSPTVVGSKNAAIIISSNDPGRPALLVKLAGKGIVNNSPVISNLLFSPPTANLGEGGGTVTITGYIDFMDPAGDLVTLRLRSLESGIDLTTRIPGISGHTSGTIYGALNVSTEVSGTYTFEVWVIDSKGNSSNTLSGTFTVLPKAIDEVGTQPGDLDGAFGTNGMSFYDDPVFMSDEEGRAVAIQSDGKIVVTGYIYNGIRNMLLVMRYNSDGTPDDTFGTNGVVTFNKEIGPDEGYGVVIQPDGKIVVAGYSDEFDAGGKNVLLLRLNSDGALDDSFGTGGVATFDLNPTDYGYAVAIQPDGKIVVAGETWTAADKYALVLRCNSDGTLDDTFGNDGIVTYDGIGWDAAYGVALQADGKMVITGSTSAADPETAVTDVLVLRLNSDGTFDNTFGTNGIVTYDNINESGRAVAIQPDGKIMIAGGIWSYSSYENAVLVLRYNGDGTLDSSFGTGGVVTYNKGEPDYMYGNSIALQPDGKIVVAGYIADSLGANMLVLRYTGEGAPDTSFSDDGIGRYASGGNAHGYGTAIQSDGRILVTGNSSYHDNYSDFAVLILRINGL